MDFVNVNYIYNLLKIILFLYLNEMRSMSRSF